MNVEVLIEDCRWEQAELERLSLKALQAVLAHFNLGSERFEVDILACDDARIAQLNGDFRETAKATNVLSWPSQERTAQEDGADPNPFDQMADDPSLGDIALSYPTCRAEADAAGLVFSDHILHLLVHSMLHLLGYDHKRDLDATLMEGLEIEILGKLGVNNPYKEITKA